MNHIHYLAWTIACVAGITFAADTAKKPAEKVGETPAEKASPGGAAGELHSRICENYLQSKWDDLDKDLRAPAAEFASMTVAQKADVDYVRQVLAECRPAWWMECKAGKKLQIRPVLWNTRLNVMYDPNSANINFSGFGPDTLLTVGWKPSEVDNTAHAEHGFSKGELQTMSIWGALGMGQAWGTATSGAIGNDEKTRAHLSKYLAFRNNVSSIYYGTPRSRRWSFWLYLAAYMDKYSKMPEVECRKVIGSMLFAEVLANPAKYPSLTPPAKMPADKLDAKLADHYRLFVEKRSWTLAEDKAIREAVKAFANSNEKDVFKTGKVQLPNGLTHLLDSTAEDTPYREKREAWIKTHLEKASK